MIAQVSSILFLGFLTQLSLARLLLLQMLPASRQQRVSPMSLEVS